MHILCQVLVQVTRQTCISGALQELQADLRQVMHLRQRSAEYQLSHYGSNGAQYVRHRDAFPDDGSEEQQRRVLTFTPSHAGATVFADGLITSR